MLGVSASTMALAGATIRRPIDGAFDLGTGCGIQAVHASDHSRRVVASDVNPRAVACATLTMELNELAHVTVRTGDRFEPVPGERFDLIVANPPFVISPSRRYLFRDSDEPVDDLCRSIVQSAPDHLTEGGHCQLLASWAHVEGEDWQDRLAGWFAGTGCDALVLEREALEPAAHAASWLRQTERPERWRDEFDAWVAYGEAHRHRGDRVRADHDAPARAAANPGSAPRPRTQDIVMPCGDHLGAAFELADFLQAHDDGALLDVVLERGARCRAGRAGASRAPDGWVVATRQLRQTAGLGHHGDVDPGVAAIVGGCDGRRPLAAVLETAARRRRRRARDLTAAALPIVRRLVERAFLLPVAPRVIRASCSP